MDWAILGCGYVGTRLARSLLVAGHRVRVCARNAARLSSLGKDGAEVHELDGADARAFGPALAGLRSAVVVYSIPPITTLSPGEPVRRAADAALHAGAQRFIYLGSIAVYGEAEHGRTIDEDTPTAGDDDALRRLAEEAAVETAARDGLAGVVLRLSAIYGPGRGARERLLTGGGRLTLDDLGWSSRVHVDDLVEILRVAADRAPSSARYCVADDHPAPEREVIAWLSPRVGLPPPPSVPSVQAGASRRAVPTGKVSNARLKRELEYVFRYPSFLEGEQAIEREAGLFADLPSPAQNPFDGRYDPDDTEYERYLKTAELLSLHKAPEKRAHPDELLFQSVHQVEELWMKLMIHELGQMVLACDADRLEAARGALDRVRALGELLERQLKLFETMLPSAYLAIRSKLGRGSGLDSPGFQRLNAIAPEVWAAFERALSRRSVDLMEIYVRPASQPALLAVAEGLVDFDAAMQRFKREHIMVVRRIIGIGTASLRGNPMDLLEKSAKLTYFPSLWAVRDGMFVDFKAGTLEM
jgi:tryptophan 2,3-dioxygenase